MNAVITPTRIRISIDRYQRMGEAGVLTPADRVELIEGEIFGMPPIGTLHASISGMLFKELVIAVGDGALVRAGNPLDLGEYSEPEPDLLLLRGQPENYRHAHPRAADVLLVIEVSDSSLGFDTGLKRDLYAKFAIAEYWVIDIKDRRILSYLDPVQGTFAQTREYLVGDSVSPRVFPDIKITVGDLFR